jgi:hypothetical protein
LVGQMRPLLSQIVQESDRGFTVTIFLMPEQTLTVGKVISPILPVCYK